VEALGELFGAGARGIRRDPARACDYFEQVPAERADAQHNIATCYYDGVGRPRDHAKARVHYARAIAAGFTQSQCALGNMLIKGDGVDRDLAKAQSWFERAHAHGRADAAFRVFQTLFQRGYVSDGERASVDPGLLQDAVEWARVAAEADPDTEHRKLAGEASDAIQRIMASVKAAD
jgi:uncharacterized protein